MIRISDLCLHAGDFRLDGLSFDVEEGQYAVLMGRTGSGKTTLLEAIAGLKKVERGSIFLGDRIVTNWRPADRNIGYVPQDGALFPTMTVRVQLGFALTIRRWDSARIDGRVQSLAEMLEIEHLLDRTPRGLSGGEQQRVALGRAIASNPSTLLLDEPLSALDQETHEQMMQLLKRIQRHTGATCLHVTHNELESDRLADVCLRIVDGGVVRQSRGETKRTTAPPPTPVPRKSADSEI